jgi:hypothetical protein
MSLSLFFLCVFVVKMYGDGILGSDSTDICAVAAIREPSAANAPIQRHPPNQPPDKIVNSAVSPVLPASHFSGKYAKCAINKKNSLEFFLSLFSLRLCEASRGTAVQMASIVVSQSAEPTVP